MAKYAFAFSFTFLLQIVCCTVILRPRRGLMRLITAWLTKPLCTDM